MTTAPDRELAERLRRWRRELHRIPELAFAEHRTGDHLAQVLAELGLEVTRGIGGTGLVATLRRGGRSDGAATVEPVDRAIALRAELDALPLTERGEDPDRSQHDGVMHACGHDGHLAMVLGAAHVLATEGGFDGTVHLVLQPAEEPGRGAAAMIADGLFERFPVRAIFGLHLTPGHPAGWFGTRPGALMAAEDDFEIRITGRGGHSSRPDLVVDPLVVAAELVLALQTVVARSIDPADSAVVSCTELLTDGARNAIPGEVVVRGDTRSFTPVVRDRLEQRIRELAEGICAAHGATCRISYTHEFEPTINHPEATAVAVAAARRVLPTHLVDPDAALWPGSEDFGVYAQVVPSCFAFLGNGIEPGAGGTPLHSPDFRVNDDVLEVGARYFVELVRSALPVDAAVQLGAALPVAPGWVANPARDRGWHSRAVPDAVREFHRAMPGYAPTRLVDLPVLAAELGVGRVLAKDESDRFGLPAFKALGASWAIHQALLQHPAATGGDLLTLVTATDGNHGRAVARFARRLGHRAAVYLPDGVHPAAVQAIRDEGATTTEVGGSYDEAVAAAAAAVAADPQRAVLVQDTAWEGYEEVPGWIVDGYATLFAELDDQLAALGIERPDLALVPTGVGSLLQAALTHYRSGADGAVPDGTAVVAVEPTAAACVRASIAAGVPTQVTTSVTSMAGLNCGTVSSLAWPVIRPGLDGCVAVDDAAAAEAAHDLAALGVAAGPCGAASLAAARTLLASGTPQAIEQRRSTLGLSPTSTVVLLVTEGAAANPVDDGR